MDELKLPNELVALPLIRQEHAASFSLALSLWEHALQFFPGGERVGVGKQSVISLCLFAAYTKQMRAYAAAYRLCYQGLGIEADSHCRAMFSVLLYLRALKRSSDQAEFARRWGIWCVANANQQVQDVSKIWPNIGSQVMNYEDMFAEEKRVLGKRWKDFLRYGPALKNLRDLAKDVATEELYRAYYPQASAAPHGYDILKYIRPNNAGPTRIMLHPDGTSVFESLSGATHFLTETLADINGILELKRSKNIDQMRAIGAALRSKSKRAT